MANRLTVVDIRNAFTVQSIARQERAEIVARYMGDSPVPPSWTYASVRGIFGKKVARIWARKLRHRPAGAYRDGQGRWLHPVVQTMHDFELASKLNYKGIFEGPNAADFKIGGNKSK